MKSTICFLIKDGKVYLANKKRGFGTGYLNGYGGKEDPEKDLTIEDTAARETNEESGSGVKPQNLKKVAVIDFFEKDKHIFECHVFFNWERDNDPREGEEMGRPEPYDMEDLPYDRMWDADKSWLPLVFAGKKIRARSVYADGMDKQISFEYEEVDDL